MPRPVRSTPAFTRRTLAVLSALTLAAAPLSAAAASSASPAAPLGHPAPAADSAAVASPRAAPTGPRLDGVGVAARMPRADRDAADARADAHADAHAALQPAKRRHHGPTVALMIVGATAVVLGILVGDDVRAPLVVGGAVVGLIGLYRYLL